MAELKLNDSATWRQATNVYVNDSGTWRDIAEVYVNDSGTWRSVFFSEIVTITSVGISFTSVTPANSNVSYILKADGNINQLRGAVTTDIGDWLVPTTNVALYSAKATITSAATSTGVAQGTYGSFLALTSDRSWGLLVTDNTAPNTSTMTILIEIAKTADTATILDSASITFTCNVGI